MKDRAIRYLLARMQESSTLRGLVLAVAGAVGYDLADTKVVLIIAAGNLVAGLLAVMLPDKVPE